jgi:tRNA/tmRNA/rRNA uracil-C5-methylase (TrmA/RlmC/RlmD family)
MIRANGKPAQRLDLGFLRHDNRLLVDVEACAIAEPALNEQPAVRARPPPKGGLKVVLRMAPEGWVVPPDSFFQNNSICCPDWWRCWPRAAGGGRVHDTRVRTAGGFLAIELAADVESFLGIELDVAAIQAARQNAATRGVQNASSWRHAEAG